jgi:hypothetical protein
LQQFRRFTNFVPFATKRAEFDFSDSEPVEWGDFHEGGEFLDASAMHADRIATVAALAPVATH